MTPLLPLEQFREVLSYNPWHFWGLTNSLVPLDSKCNTVVRKYSWQGLDIAGRNEINEAIETAETRLRELLGFSVAPHFAEYTRPYPEFYDQAVRRWGYSNAIGQWISVPMPEGKIIAAGPEQLTLIGNVAVTITDADSDGVLDTFTTAGLPTTVTDASDLAVYFAAADRLDSDPVSSRWRVEPVKITISAGSAVVKGRSWIVVKPILYEGRVQNQGLDPNTAANYVTTVDIYERKPNVTGTTTDTVQALLTWETAPWPYWALPVGSGNASDPAAVGQALARVALRDVEMGVLGFAEAVYDSTNGQWYAVNCGNWLRPPDRVTIRVYAGDDVEQWGWMKQTWRTVVARLACAEMAHRICTCDIALREFYRWQLDLARAGGTAIEQFNISPEDLNNPLGTKAGQVYAWKVIKSNMHVQGVLA